MHNWGGLKLLRLIFLFGLFFMLYHIKFYISLVKGTAKYPIDMHSHFAESTTSSPTTVTTMPTTRLTTTSLTTTKLTTNFSTVVNRPTTIITSTKIYTKVHTPLNKAKKAIKKIEEEVFSPIAEHVSQDDDSGVTGTTLSPTSHLTGIQVSYNS